MSKTRYYPNLTLSDPELPFTLEVSRSMTVYARRKYIPGNTFKPIDTNEMVKVDSIFMKRQNKIIVNHKGLKITISGYDKLEKRFIYKIEKEEKPES